MSTQPTELVLHDLANEIAPLVLRAEMVSIADQPSYDEAAAFIKDLTAGIKKVEDFLAPHKANAYRAWKDLTEHETRLTKPAKDAKTILSRKIVDWEQEQERKRRELQRQAEEEARRKDEEDRLRAAESAQAEGCSEDLIDAILEEEAPAPAVAVQRTFTRAKGVSAPSWRYSAKIVDLVALARYVVANPIDQGFLVGIRKRSEGPGFECPAINARAVSQKDLFQLPGCELVKTASIAVRG